MADRDDRGTTMDPAWDAANLTGGNDSGTARVDKDNLDRADGPDLTARILEDQGTSLPAQGPETAAPADDTVTDESGRIAATDAPVEESARGGARDPRVAGEQVTSG